VLENLTGLVLDGRYEIQSLLGKGGMGLVYAAYDRTIGCQVAVKIINPGLPSEVIEKLTEEARMTAGLEHKHILSVYDRGTQLVEGQTLAYFVILLARGGTLADRLRTKGPLTPYEAERILKQVCSALDYAHDRKIIHLDLKPANILFDEHGDALVADFGLARHFRTAAPETADPKVGGTLDYSPPEQWQRQTHAGRHSDIYALGITLYESLTGKLPEKLPVKKSLVAHLSQPLAFDIRAVIERATHIEPAKRYHTAGALARAFTAAVGPFPVSGQSGALEDSLPQTDLRRGLWTRRLLVGLVIIAIAAGMIVMGRWLVEEQKQSILEAVSQTMTALPTATVAPTAAQSPSPTPPPTDTPTLPPSPTPYVVTATPLPTRATKPTSTPGLSPNTMLPLRNPGFNGIQPNDIPGWEWWAMDNWSPGLTADSAASFDTPFFGPTNDATGVISGTTLKVVATAFVKFRVYISQTTSAPAGATTRFQVSARAHSDQGGIMAAAGIDPNGGSDCSQARWGSTSSVDQSWGIVQLFAPVATVGPAGRVTVCLYAETAYPAHNNAVFFDDAELTANPE
jgi:serine/threonine protein kinase